MRIHARKTFDDKPLETTMKRKQPILVESIPSQQTQDEPVFLSLHDELIVKIDIQLAKDDDSKQHSLSGLLFVNKRIYSCLKNSQAFWYRRWLFHPSFEDMLFPGRKILHYLI